MPDWVVVWCGSHRTPLCGDYDRRPYLAGVTVWADVEKPAPPKKAKVTHPCACGCGIQVRVGVRWVRGHHAGRRKTPSNE